MLEYAIHGGVPLIAISTTDPANVLSYLTFRFGSVFSFEGVVNSHRLYLTTGTIPGKDSPAVLSNRLTAAGSVLLVVNPKEPIPEAFDAGTLVYPAELVAKRVEEVIGITVKGLETMVKGLTVKEAIEIAKITMAKHPSVSKGYFQDVRSQLLGTSKGLFLVPTDAPEFYWQDDALEGWIANNQLFFMADKGVDKRLVPRGLLFNGPPGVGKSMGAKRIAGAFQVPLFRLDLSASMSKWHGESESNLAYALAKVDQEEPCLLLLDEIEKIFSAATEEVTQRLLAQLLWWLQEHTSRVLVVMTTNNLEGLPPELYRPGRVDKVLDLAALKPATALIMAENLLSTFKLSKGQRELTQAAITQELMSHLPGPISHAEVTQIVYGAIKNTLLE